LRAAVNIQLSKILLLQVLGSRLLAYLVSVILLLLAVAAVQAAAAALADLKPVI
jgi:hypothetical protein